MTLRVELIKNLVSLGKRSRTALERIYQQTEVLIQMISDHGGSGPFIVDGLTRSGRYHWRNDPDVVLDYEFNTQFS